MTEIPTLRFRCAKCGHSACEVGEVRVAGGLLSSVLDFENRKFSSITCARCRHTEFYQVESSKLAAVFDFFTT